MKKLIILIVMLTGISMHIKAQSKVKDLMQQRTDIYFLNYYYEDEPHKTIYTRSTGRIVNSDASFCLVDYDLKDMGKITYSTCFNAEAVPTHYGNEKEITNVFKDNIHLNFKGRDTMVYIDSEKELKNATNLWFWKYMPKVNETIIVGGIRKNFITNAIDKVNVSYTYLGKEKLKILGKINTYYLVKSFPLNGFEGVYDQRWYDKKGMMVKERHVVGKDGIRVAELNKIVKQY